jgi:hypothetical protein
MAKITVEGIPELLRQFPEFTHDLLEASNKASIDAMRPALDTAKNTGIFQDRGRATSSKGNPAHPAGNLRSKIRLFFVNSVKRGKTRVWATLGVPYGSGAAYYMPLVLGHKSRGRRDKKDFLTEAYKAADKGAKEKITAAINGVITKYGR